MLQSFWLRMSSNVRYKPPSLSYDAEAGVLDFVQSIRPGGGRLAGLGRHQSANQNLYHLAEPSQDWKRSKDLQENG